MTRTHESVAISPGRIDSATAQRRELAALSERGDELVRQGRLARTVFDAAPVPHTFVDGDPCDPETIAATTAHDLALAIRYWRGVLAAFPHAA